LLILLSAASSRDCPGDRLWNDEKYFGQDV